MRQSQIILGATVLALRILSLGPGVRATEPPEGDATPSGFAAPNPGRDVFFGQTHVSASR